LLLANIPSSTEVSDRADVEAQVDDFPYVHSALRLRRDPFSGIKRALGIASNKVFDRMFQEMSRFLVRDILHQDLEVEQSSRGAREFEDAVGQEVSHFHRELMARGLANPDGLRENLAGINLSAAVRLAALFKRLEEKPEYRYMLASFSRISDKKIPNGGEARWAMRASIACLIAAAFTTSYEPLTRILRNPSGNARQ
jgi:hypothetical protein